MQLCIKVCWPLFTFCFFLLALLSCGVTTPTGGLSHSTTDMCALQTPISRMGMTYVTSRITTLYLKEKNFNSNRGTVKK